MFSDIGKIFLQTPRHAENADARLDIKRHDPDQERRKKDQKENSPDPFGDEEFAMVSVEALRLFLINFLKEQEQKNTPPSSAPAPQAPAAPISPGASRAANAYAAGARTKTQAPPEIKPLDEQPPQEPQLQSHEVRTIHKLLQDLKIITEKNIDVLRIERSDTFLNALVAAVEKACLL